MWSFTIKIFFNKIDNYFKKKKKKHFVFFNQSVIMDYTRMINIYTFFSISASNPCWSQLGNEEAEEPNVNVHSSAKNIWLGSNEAKSLLSQSLKPNLRQIK